jgi:phosphoribosylanthranilate isomerase
MHIKICGITRGPDAHAALAAGADFVGLILAPSVRQLTVGAAAAIARGLPAGTNAVLVFRDAPAADVLAAIEACDASWVQLHGHEPPDYVIELRQARPSLRIIKAFEVRDLTAADTLTTFCQAVATAGADVQILLLDAPKSCAHPGYETMMAVAQRAGAALRTGHPRAAVPETWCAGGLTPTNVAQVARFGKFAGVDVAGGVESGPGVKDAGLMQAFVAAVRGIRG